MNASDQTERTYDVVIVGGGVVGTALLYVLATYTNIQRLALLEKRSALGCLNSNKNHNSQTLHFGDIETHYSVDRAKEVNRMASFMKHFLEKEDPEQTCWYKSHKMVIGLGEKQVKELKDRFEQIKGIYPEDELLETAQEIAQYEPCVIEGRNPDQPIAAILSHDGYAVNYGGIASLFAQKAQEVEGKVVDVCVNTSVSTIERLEDELCLNTNNGSYHARVAEVAAAAYSLSFARQYGLAQDIAIVNMAGNFYCAPPVLSGKVYRMQQAELPFAAVHGDPEVSQEHEMVRFGPTAKAVLMMERKEYGTVWDYLKHLGLDWRRYAALFSVLAKPVYLKFVALNLLYDIPYIGKRLFLHQVRKVVPTIRARDLTRSHGGIRPQIIHVQKRKPMMGAGKVHGDRLIFNITPSPGASVSLGSAEEDVQCLVEMLGGDACFDHQRFEKDLLHSQA